MELEIIDFVRQHRILYEPEFRKSRYKEAKEKKWIELARKLKVPTTAVRKRWKTLRDKYCRDKKAIDCGEKIASWKYAKPMEFMSSVLRPQGYGAEYYADSDARNDSYGDQADETMEYISKMDDNTVLEIETVEESFINHPENSSFESVFLNDQKPNVADIERNNAVSRSTTEFNQTYHESRSAGQINNNVTSCPKKAAAVALGLLPKRQVVPLTPTRSFFNSLAMQIDAANLPNDSLFTLQRKIMNVVHQAILDMEHNLGNAEEENTKE